MDTHGVAGDLGDVLICERDLVPAVTGSDQVLEIFGALQADLVEDFLHGELCGLDRVDFAL